MTDETDSPKRLYGMAEAERQLRVAKRLYAATDAKLTWDKISKEKRRPFIDQSCQRPYVDQLE